MINDSSSMAIAVFSSLFPRNVRFFQVNQIDFPSSPKALKRPCFGQIFCAADKFLKKHAKKFVCRLFLRNFDHKTRLFVARSPLIISIYWSQMHFQKIRVHRQKKFLKIVQRRYAWGRQGVESLRKKIGRPLPPP